MYKKRKKTAKKEKKDVNEQPWVDLQETAHLTVADDAERPDVIQALVVLLRAAEVHKNSRWHKPTWVPQVGSYYDKHPSKGYAILGTIELASLNEMEAAWAVVVAKVRGEFA